MSSSTASPILDIVCLCAAWCGTCREYEATFAQLQARIEATIAWLESLPADAFETDREIVLKFGQQQVRFDSARYLAQFALPNFFFHITTAYAILRHHGVAIGKLDYLGRIGEATPA